MDHSKDLTIQDSPTDLSVKFSDTAVQTMQTQIKALKEFVQSQMHKDVDYGVIPGTHKPSLYKPGAEKLRKIFQLGTRIISKDVVRENEPPFVMYTYLVEVFHIPSGKGIAQCEGSANSNERKYKKVDLPDLHNTLMKMAQKRAEVGATINAVNASDLFTQDVEDLKGTGLIPNVPATNTGEVDWDNYKLTYGRVKDKYIKECSKQELLGFVDWARNKAKVTAPKVVEQTEMIEFYLREVLPTQGVPVPSSYEDTDEELPF